MVSPDASLVRVDRWQVLSPEEHRGFAPLCPDLVVQLASPADEGLRGVTAHLTLASKCRATRAP